MGSPAGRRPGREGVRATVLVEALGRYRIERELGRGAMGQVFLAYDPQIDRRVAIKTIQIFAALPARDRVQARERFLREARAAGKLLHPGIVTVFDVGEADGVPYLAMEYVEGQTLDAFGGEDGLLPVPLVIELIAAAAEALAFAHERGIVHRDVKPANLMRVRDAQIKVMDFGLAKSATTQMTNDGALLGTPNYMAPEQVRGEVLDGRADLFSLAVVLYELLTGEKPFAGDSVSSVLYRIVHEPPREPSFRLDRVPAPIATFLQKALAKTPEARFPDGKAFAAELRAAGQTITAAPRVRPAPGAPLPEPLPRTAASPAPHRGGRPPRVGRSATPYVFGAGVLIAALAAAWIYLEGRTSPPRAALPDASVRTDPPGLPVLLNGRPLAGSAAPVPGQAPFGVLTASQGCRQARHRLESADAGTTIVLALDPLRAEVPVDPGIATASVTVNGAAAGAAPVQLDLDLCRENTIEAGAAGYRPATVIVPAGATPLQARAAAAGLKLERIPTGRILLPATRYAVRFTVDGKPVERTASGFEIAAGSHQVSAVSDDHFVEVTASVDVPADGSVAPSFRVPELARLTVQTFPPNASVSLKKSDGAFRQVGETPLRTEVGAGRYTLRVRSSLSDETREQTIDLRAGLNPPVRIAFGRGGR